MHITRRIGDISGAFEMSMKAFRILSRTSSNSRVKQRCEGSSETNLLNRRCRKVPSDRRPGSSDD